MGLSILYPETNVYQFKYKIRILELIFIIICYILSCIILIINFSKIFRISKIQLVNSENLNNEKNQWIIKLKKRKLYIKKFNTF